MNKLFEAHYLILPTQANVYSFAILKLCSGLIKFVVASLKKKLFLFEYSETSAGILKPNVKEVSCSYIPSGAEIVGVDAFNKSDTYDDFQIGVTLAKANTDGGIGGYFNIYSEQDPDTNNKFNIDNISQNCAILELSFVPYHLTHSNLLHFVDGSNSKEIVWLLSGSDCKIHVYVEDRQNHSYIEGDINELFPELTALPSLAMWIDIHYTNNFIRRISAVACECGTLQLSLVVVKTNVILNKMSVTMDSPITQIKLFSLSPKEDICSPFISHPSDVHEESGDSDELSDLHLLVCKGLLPTVVYMNVGENWLSEKHVLVKSDHYDVNLCACVGDINFDGCNEIMLGSFARKILMYSWVGDKWELSSERNTVNSVHSIHYVDVTNDGVNELIIHTQSAVHILQHDPKEVHNVVMSRLMEEYAEGGIPPVIKVPFIEGFQVHVPQCYSSVHQNIEEQQQDWDAMYNCSTLILEEHTPAIPTVRKPLLDTIEVQNPLSATDVSQKPLTEIEDYPCEEAFEQTEN